MRVKDAQTIVLFGESERGEFNKGYYFRQLPELIEYLGQPPEGSQGLYYAIQALLFEQQLLFFRVKEEGFSLQDYQIGLHLVEQQKQIGNLAALCAPGVGTKELMDAMISVCLMYNMMLITTESDLYDYLTSLKP